MGTPAPDAVKRLLDRFDANRESYRSPHYNEAPLQREFLDPLFKALDWDVCDNQGLTEVFKPVIHEGSIKVCPERSRRVAGATGLTTSPFHPRIQPMTKRPGLHLAVTDTESVSTSANSFRT